MQNKNIKALVLAAGLIFTSAVVHAIDGDLGNPYASGAEERPAPRAPGEVPVYGGRDASVPAVSFVGAVLVILGAGAALYWQLRSVRMARRSIAE